MLAFVAPGPRVTNAIPGRPVSARHKRGATFLAASNDIYPSVIMKRIEHREEALARDCKDSIRPLLDETFDQQRGSTLHQTLPCLGA